MNLQQIRTKTAYNPSAQLTQKQATRTWLNSLHKQYPVALKIRNEIRLTAEQTKGNDARVVFVSEKLRKELEKYIKVYKPVNPNVKFFYSQKQGSDGFTANTLTQFFHFLYKKAGIDGASSHSGRRTFITNLASKGVSVRVLASLAGHKNISTTQCYIDVNDDMKRKAVELV